jgi:ATP-dependent protease ClpP protease subunit
MRKKLCFFLAAVGIAVLMSPVLKAQESSEARDSLTNALVTIHSFQKDLVEQGIQEKLKIAAKSLQRVRNETESSELVSV